MNSKLYVYILQLQLYSSVYIYNICINFTMEYMMGRINLQVDDAGIIVAVTCG